MRILEQEAELHRLANSVGTSTTPTPPEKKSRHTTTRDQEESTASDIEQLHKLMTAEEALAYSQMPKSFL